MQNHAGKESASGKNWETNGKQVETGGRQVCNHVLGDKWETNVKRRWETSGRQVRNSCGAEHSEH